MGGESPRAIKHPAVIGLDGLRAPVTVFLIIIKDSPLLRDLNEALLNNCDREGSPGPVLVPT